MSFNLYIVNMWLGLCRGDAGLPRFFRDQSYAVTHIEERFRIGSNGREIVPELVMHSTPFRHLILLESKEGTRVNPDQLERYASVDNSTVAQIVGGAITGYTFDCMVNGQEKHVTSLQSEMIALGSHLPLLGVGTVVRLFHNSFSRGELNTTLRDGLEVNPHSVTTRVQFSADSAVSKIGRVVVTRLIDLLVRGERQIEAPELCERIFREGWTLSGIEERKRLYSKVGKVLTYGLKRKYLEEVYSIEGKTIHIKSDFDDKEAGNAKSSFLGRQRARAREMIEALEHEKL